MDSKNLLTFLGLALRGGRLVIGEEPVEAVCRARDARLLLLASDAADNTRRRCAHFAEAGQCLRLTLPFTKEELGQTLGRTSVAIAAMTDIGMASSLANRLAEMDPAQYAEAAVKLDLKAQRAAERKAEQRAHEKNVRTGKRKPTQEPPAPPAAEKRQRRPKAEVSPAERGARPPAGHRSPRPSKENRPKPRAKANPYAHSRPVKKGTGSFRKKEG